MSCGCKKPIDPEFKIGEEKKNIKPTEYIFRVFIFLFSLVTLPLILGFSVYVLFDTLVLSNSVNVKPILLKMGKLLQEKQETVENTDNEGEEYIIEDSLVYEFDETN